MSRQQPSDDPRQRLADIRSHLVSLHKTLIDSERAAYEQTFGPLESKNQFLQLLISDPWFVWLRPLSALVVDIDEALEAEEPPTTESAAAFVAQVRGLLKTSEEGHGFPRSYFEALQREPDVVLAHAAVIKALNGTPEKK